MSQFWWGGESGILVLDAGDSWVFSSDVKTFSSLFHDNSDLVFLFQRLVASEPPESHSGEFSAGLFLCSSTITVPFPLISPVTKQWHRLFVPALWNNWCEPETQILTSTLEFEPHRGFLSFTSIHCVVWRPPDGNSWGFKKASGPVEVYGKTAFWHDLCRHLPVYGLSPSFWILLYLKVMYSKLNLFCNTWLCCGSRWRLSFVSSSANENLMTSSHPFFGNQYDDDAENTPPEASKLFPSSHPQVATRGTGTLILVYIKVLYHHIHLHILYCA